MTTRNEAAERLRSNWEGVYENVIALDRKVLYRWYGDLDEALAAERRATVERIRERCLEARKKWGAEGLPASLQTILDEEADR